MARFVKKLGAQQMRFQFDIELHSISLTVPYACKLQIVWKKGKYAERGSVYEPLSYLFFV